MKKMGGICDNENIIKKPAHIFRLCANTGSGSLPTALKRISKPNSETKIRIKTIGRSR